MKKPWADVDGTNAGGGHGFADLDLPRGEGDVVPVELAQLGDSQSR